MPVRGVTRTKDRNVLVPISITKTVLVWAFCFVVAMALTGHMQCAFGQNAKSDQCFDVRKSLEAAEQEKARVVEFYRERTAAIQDDLKSAEQAAQSCRSATPGQQPVQAHGDPGFEAARKNFDNAMSALDAAFKARGDR